MKRTPFKRRISQYQKDLEAMKPWVEARSLGRCEAMVADNCTMRAVHIHHRKYRSRGGTNALSNLLHVCLACHDWIHSNAYLSNLTGLSLHEWESEDESL